MDAVAQTLREYVTPHGRNPFREWLHGLRDLNARAKIRVRLNRVRLGNFGDAKVVMKKTSASYERGLKGALASPEEAAAYLNAALEDGSQDVFLMALRDVADARGLARLARETSLNRENMYRILSKTGNPQLSSLKAVLDSLGLKLAVEPKRAAA